MIMVKNFFTEVLPEYLQKALGLALIITAIFLLISFMTYNPIDPSWNNATEEVIHNLGGLYGAYIADPSLQALGYASFVLVIFFFTLGIKVLNAQLPNLLILRISALIIALMSSAVCLAFVQSHSMDIKSYGGFVGFFMVQELTDYFPASYVLVTALLLTITNVAFALLLSFAEWKKLAIYLLKSIAITIAMCIWSIKFLYVKSYALIVKLKGEGEEGTEVYIPQVPSPSEAIANITEKTILHDKKSPASKRKVIKAVQTSFNFDAEGPFKLPGTDLLQKPKTDKTAIVSRETMLNNAQELAKVLQDFGIKGEIVGVKPGPVVTLYEFEPAAGTKSSRVISLADDIARSMMAISARIAVIPGKNALGIEIPNSKREIVYLRDIMESSLYQNTSHKLPLVLGKNIGGDAVIADLAKMPHLLVAGTTGSGKSVAVNTMILSLLYRYSPKECQFIMIDPKMLELSVYDDIPHLLAPVVTEPKRAICALKWVVKEMEDRYRSMSSVGVRNITGFNDMVREAQANDQILTKEVQIGFDPENGEPIYETVEIASEPLPFIVVIVDEMADLMLVAGKDIEGSIQRLAQMARAAGIHLIMATQRPSVDVITGVIKANFPTRISFQVTSKIDSRTILGEQGAEQLLGMGDMLYMSSGSRIERVHGPFVSDREVESVVIQLKKQGRPQYRQEVTATDDDEDEQNMDFTSLGSGPSGDDLYDQAVAIVLRDGRASTSYVQRCLKIGYNRAANLIEKMEKEGVISAPSATGKREVLAGEGNK
jgi:S-DNA-T family DNA segregation ATPase FtsK/SpoIIIE